MTIGKYPIIYADPPWRYTQKGLQGAAEHGLDAAIFFVVQLKDVNSVAPNDATHPAFGQALREAAAHGVRVLAYDCNVTPDSLTIRREVPVIL